jgi:acetolactate synthase-1/2/3 large subunit
MKNGANTLINTLTNAGIDTCFTNPGTSEMHFVAALDQSKMRAVLCLFEGVATGAADGYARMAKKPAATLLHLGCGLGNGIANLHNARKARVPMLNIIGDHATYHKQYNAPLESDIETLARNVSSWVRTSATTDELKADTLEAIQVAQTDPQQISTLILPADVSWGLISRESTSEKKDCGEQDSCVDEATLSSETASPASPIAARLVAPEEIEILAEILKRHGKKVAILLGRRVLLEEGLVAASKIAETTGAKLFSEVFPTRLERGAGLPAVERIAYLSELAAVQLAGYKHLIIIDSSDPVSFFAYPNKQSYLVPKKCTVHRFVQPDENAIGSLCTLVDAVGAEYTKPKRQPLKRPSLPSGYLNAAKVCQAVGALMPDNSIISDEAQTSGLMLPLHTVGAPKHDLLTLTGGAIGQGLPVAIGASIASSINSLGTANKDKNRPVIALVGDGSSMYTIQSLWTMVNEHLDITVIILNNRSYAILNIELQRVGADSANKNGTNEKAKSQLDLSKTAIDFVALAKGMGMPAQRATTTEEFNNALQKALNEPGPHLIDAIVPSEYQGLKLKALPHVLNAMSYIPVPLAKAIKNKLAP